MTSSAAITATWIMNLNLDKKAEKGCILNSRITWFFSNAYTLLKDESLLDEAKHGNTLS